ncbi:hypothetical protein [Paenibacillus sp. Leaf72]|uniref:hypothetical protein n=1 Tax=Paenibacillus sp. Leaf72 TaxID=1736234 RepID=UPI0006F29F88|nr:hypothetical protein [Paenibacillus sp. Leaf72]KQN96920.1 hypothetical protein ASF12_22895 [Paenibacillus sp. Leaf72]
MKARIREMQEDILKLIEWQNRNQDVPAIVKAAVSSHKAELVKAVGALQEPPFDKGETVELCSSSYEDSGLYSGDVGRVLDLTTSYDSIGNASFDIRVSWNKGVEECWISAEDFYVH